MGNGNYLVLAIAAYLDYLIGDPWGWPHPVRGMGWIIYQFVRGIVNNPLAREESYFTKNRIITHRLAGIVLAIILVTGSGFSGWIIVQAARFIHPLFGVAVEGTILASCFAARSLRDAADDVLQPLTQGDLTKARETLSNYVGRDTENLSSSEILRAVLETVTENATDGVMAPLFYAIAGCLIPMVGAVPLALAYKAASTLDSMVGYRAAPYTYIGWFSAKMEDVLTWLPCRLTVLTLALLSGKPIYVWNRCRRDATADPSPNSGWSECAYAAVLGVQVGGINWYRGEAKHKPLLGEPINPITPERIQQATRLTRNCFLIWIAIAIQILLAWV
jgi:adenosylcobinamide-phosphate synthase